MATISSIKTGNWSDTTVWDLGRLPISDDDVNLVHVVTLNVNDAVVYSMYIYGAGQLKLANGSALVVTTSITKESYNNINALTLVNSSVNATITCPYFGSTYATSAFASFNIGAGYRVTINGNLASTLPNSGSCIAFLGAGELVINGDLQPYQGGNAKLIDASSATAGSILTINGIVKGGRGQASLVYTIVCSSTLICNVNGGIHLATNANNRNYFPISGNYVNINFGDASKNEFSVIDSNYVFHTLKGSLYTS